MNITNFFISEPSNSREKRPGYKSPEFSTSSKKLYLHTRQILLERHQIKLTEENPNEGTMNFVERTKIFCFPDDIAIKIISLNENSSTLMIRSQSRYGKYDFGVNRRRVHNILKELAASSE